MKTRDKWSLFFLITVVAGLTAAIVIPNLNRRPRFAPPNSCVANLKQIAGAIQQWAIENKLEATNAPDLNAATKHLKNGDLPKCPSGGTYAGGKTVWDLPTCSKAMTLGHSLQ
ncbi:MAG: hypothetical protein K0Q55_2610 [Verrucomicrobia bacterium]|jgi:hypothetical protein|nr:hypothetical protein [Verrucomicrobiota bacterium]